MQIRSERRCAFTLLELVIVAAIIGILLVLVIPAFTGIKSATDTTTAAYTIKDALEQARSYAIANNTYVWVGFFEDDPTLISPSQPAAEGIGRAAISTVASTDGTRIYTFINSAAKTNSTLPNPLDSTTWGGGRLVQVGKITKLQGIHMIDAAANSLLQNAGLPAVIQDSQIGHPNFKSHPVPPGNATAVNPTTFGYPIGSSNPTYRFVKIVEFNPRGEAMKIVSDIAGPVDLMAVGLQPTHGNVADSSSKNLVGLTISGLTGATRVYRPGIAQ
jgi:prepilin-type N-terminal cleavage/methylation domain-containing protein